MRKTILILILIGFSTISFGQIIADHTIVDRFDDIPQYYIDAVKKMWLVVPGESHSRGYFNGLTLLEGLYPSLSVSWIDAGTPESNTNSNLRVSRATWGDVDNPSGWVYSYGEEDWWTSETAINRTKAGITYCNTHSLTIGAFGFGWCYDPIIDINDYLSATQEYIDHCKSNGYQTRVFFTTGPVEGTAGRNCYNHYRWPAVREYVAADSTRILFDYADILCYDDNGTPTTQICNGVETPAITMTNYEPTQDYHISEAGAIRLAKAMWWMLARMAGWDGVTNNIYVSGIKVRGDGGSTVINADNGTLQLIAEVTPNNATNKTVTWTVTNRTGQASINSTGLITAVSNGTVTAMATSNDGSQIYDTLVITISNQIQNIPVTRITVNGYDGLTTISTDDGTLKLHAVLEPSDATDKTVTWSLINGSGGGFISSSGIVTAVSNGTVTAKATANDGSGIYGTLQITISNQLIPVTDISVNLPDGLSSVNIEQGTIQLHATINPPDASNQTVTWSLINGTGQATISDSGLLTPLLTGTVTVSAVANDGSGITGVLIINIINNHDGLIVIVNLDEMRFYYDECNPDCRISVYDLFGRFICTEVIEGNRGIINISSFKPGLYITVLSNQSTRKVAKVLIP
jgi:uncharacterized protein YjdB